MEHMKDSRAHLPSAILEVSQSQLQPLSASVLLDQELARKARLRRKGNLMTGCNELDDYVLLGGFERGSVVGLSAEEEELGLSIGLQTIARMLAKGPGKALIITTLPRTVVLLKLQKVLASQLKDPGGGKQKIKGCLERIFITTVFNIKGLWDALRELETAAQAAGTEVPQASATQDRKPEPEMDAPESGQRTRQRTEVQDTEGKVGFHPTESPLPQEPNESGAWHDDFPRSALPDIILITNISSILSVLFASCDKPTAHDTALLLSSHLHFLSRSPAYNDPLIILLNSTTSPFSQAFHDDAVTATDTATTIGEPLRQVMKRTEPTLSSIFEPTAAQQAAAHLPGQQQQPRQRNRPLFGQVFAQMLDLHLLCTRVPRTKEDAAAAAAGVGSGFVSQVWVVEVLLDEIGVYERLEAEENGALGSRRSREQRWAAVDVDEVGDGRVVDAFRG